MKGEGRGAFPHWARQLLLARNEKSIYGGELQLQPVENYNHALIHQWLWKEAYLVENSMATGCQLPHHIAAHKA